jgi:uridine kinase
LTLALLDVTIQPLIILRSGNMIIIGIGGGSGSGKTEVATRIQAQLGSFCAILKGDDFYNHCPEKTEEERRLTNYDVIASKDFDLLLDLLKQFQSGEKIQYCHYNFSTHLRGNDVAELDPANVDFLIIDDILALAYSPLRNFFDVSVYVDADMDLALIRRLTRDTAPLAEGGRGRTHPDVIAQYLTTVRPAFIEGILPTKKKAKHVVTNNTTKDAINITPVMESIRELSVLDVTPVMKKNAESTTVRKPASLLATIGQFATPDSNVRVLPVNDAKSESKLSPRHGSF